MGSLRERMLEEEHARSLATFNLSTTQQHDAQFLAILERIAVALERIAERKERTKPPFNGKPQTAFPWNKVSQRCRGNLRSFLGYEDPLDLYEWTKQYSWPLSCEDLIEIGPDRCKQARNFGPQCVKEISAILVSLGFPNWNTE